MGGRNEREKSIIDLYKNSKTCVLNVLYAIDELNSNWLSDVFFRELKANEYGEFRETTNMDMSDDAISISNLSVCSQMTDELTDSAISTLPYVCF